MTHVLHGTGRPDVVAHADEFLPLKSRSAPIGEVRSFGGLILGIPAGIDIEAYSTVLIRCEAFGEFITAAKYRRAPRGPLAWRSRHLCFAA